MVTQHSTSVYLMHSAMFKFPIETVKQAALLLKPP